MKKISGSNTAAWITYSGPPATAVVAFWALIDIFNNVVGDFPFYDSNSYILYIF